MTLEIEAIKGDVHQLITADGNTFTVPDHDMGFQAYGPYGAPPIEFITRRGYKQHGATYIDYLLSARTISVTFYRKQTCSRLLYWQRRAELHDILRPNRSNDGDPPEITLILRQASGQKRAIKVMANPGALFNPQDTNSWNIHEQIEFIAFDPIWYDPVTVDSSVAITVDSELVFPIDFPIQFGLSGAQFIYPIVYTGSWKEYPTLILTGPYTSAIISNSATGVSISLTQGISAGDSRIITLTPGAQSIVDAAGVNKFSDLAAGSNLVEFNIRPDPQVPGGIQSITAILQGAQTYVGTGWEVQSELLAPNRWYRLDDTTTTLIDRGSDNASGVASGGYTQGIASLIAADANKATSVNGTTALLTIPSVPFQAVSYSVNLWVKFTSIAGNPVVFGADFNTAVTGQELALGVTAAGALIIFLGGGVTFSSANGLITTATTYMLSMTYDKPTAQLKGFINGVQVIGVTGSDFTAAAPACYLGSYATSNRTAGTLDEAQLWVGIAQPIANLQLLYASRLVASRTYSPSGFRIQYSNRYYAI